MAEQWFHAQFGFDEGRDFKANRQSFECVEDQAGSLTLTSKPNGKSFHVGKFTFSSVAELRAECDELVLEAQQTAEKEGKDTGAGSVEELFGLGPPSWGHQVGNDIRSIIGHVSNAGAVIQVASQFNCLEMVGPGVKPEAGISIYASDPTQGPACALACPAATVYRNYFASPKNDGSGQGGGDKHQLNGMHDVELLLDNNAHKFWKMSNGYLLPTTSTKMKDLCEHVLKNSTAAVGSGGVPKAEDATLSREIVEKIRMGVHWDTETRAGHNVAQVFASAVPCNYAKETSKTHWRLMGNLALEAAFEGCLRVAAIKAMKEHRRVTVYICGIGGGAFDNLFEWITRGISLALERCAHYPIDVRLAHYDTVVSRKFDHIKVPKSFTVCKKHFKQIQDSGLQPPPPREGAGTTACNTTTTAATTSDGNGTSEANATEKEKEVKGEEEKK